MPIGNLSHGSQALGPFCCQAVKFARLFYLQNLKSFIRLPDLQRPPLHVWELIGDALTPYFQVECV
jgi:hypothetical protein